MYSLRLYCTNTEILMYCIYTDSTTIQIQFPYHTRTLFWYRHTNMTFPPPGSCSSVYRETILTVLSLLFLVFSILILLTLEMCKKCWFKSVIENEKSQKKLTKMSSPKYWTVKSVKDVTDWRV